MAGTKVFRIPRSIRQQVKAERKANGLFSAICLKRRLVQQYAVQKGYVK